MNSVGIDLHRNRSHIAVIDEHGELSLSRRIVNDRTTFLELLGGLEGESSIAVEATDPDPQLLRPTRRRDPLPGAPQPGEREREAGGHSMTTAAHATASGLRPRPRHERNARASSLFVMASLTQDGRPLD
jgi:hypothetical protein